jgi:aspartokinase-like uncharacterized kinase
MSVTVLKLGGSLLDLADLPVRLRAVLTKLDGERPLLTCGGGEAADIVRRWHDAHGLDEERSHWLAMDSIRLNQRLLLTLMPELELVSNRAAAESAWHRGRVPLLDLMAFVGIEESQAQAVPLPHSWEVTSDSLAAWVSIQWPAQRLILLKSVDWSDAATEFDALKAKSLKLVDEHFTRLSPQLAEVTWVNLRNDAVNLLGEPFGEA